MAIIREPNTLQDILRYEHPEYTRRAETLASGKTVALAQVLGRRRVACPATGTAGTNTGNGTLTAVAAGRAVEVGTYVLECIAAVADGGRFAVSAPSGLRLADARAGQAYANSHLTFTLAAGETDYAVGDSFALAVAAGSGQVAPWDPAATDGSQIACGIAAEACDATAAARTLVMVSEQAIILGQALVWPEDATTDQKAAAMRDLAALHILSREGV